MVFCCCCLETNDLKILYNSWAKMCSIGQFIVVYNIFHLNTTAHELKIKFLTAWTPFFSEHWCEIYRAMHDGLFSTFLEISFFSCQPKRPWSRWHISWSGPTHFDYFGKAHTLLSRQDKHAEKGKLYCLNSQPDTHFLPGSKELPLPRALPSVPGQAASHCLFCCGFQILIYA